MTTINTGYTGQESRREGFEKDLRISLPGLGRCAHVKRVWSAQAETTGDNFQKYVIWKYMYIYCIYIYILCNVI